MMRHAWARTLAILIAFPLIALAQSDAPVVGKAQVQPEQLHWTQGGPGIQTAAVLGDPTKPGMYVTRLRFAKGTHINPHMHPDQRVAVVLSGSMYFGYGA